MRGFLFGKTADELAEKAIKLDSEASYHRNLSEWFLKQSKAINNEVDPMGWAVNKQKSMDHAKEARYIEGQAAKAWNKAKVKLAKEQGTVAVEVTGEPQTT